ncbi:MAG TPA: hypothetical protein K8V77_05560 [Brachyspira hyodysenteriae]|nr:hypothetical protein [Brachyspira hyodysenteriae]
MFALIKSILDRIKKRPFVKAETVGKKVIEAEVLQPSGFTSVPNKDKRAFVTNINTNYKVIIAFEDLIDEGLKEGEACVYSNDDTGNIKAKIKLLKDGSIELEGEKIKLNGEDKSFVTYKELDLALQQLWTSIKNHTHSYTAPPSPSLLETAPSVALSTVNLDISNSETKTIKTGG